MTILDIFEKDITRFIEGVVKAPQVEEEIVLQELEEYVVTKELHRHFDKFFESYRKGTQQRTNNIGVWISGFFGSGKSHFLKILAYLLSDNLYDGRKAIDFFDGKILDSRILADMQIAANTSTDVILFNIDMEADADSKYNKEAIVTVFMKLFNKAQGFCCSMPWIADLERKMTQDGVYEAFCARFEELSGSDWASAREDYYFEEDSIIQALADTTKMSAEAAKSWYDKAEKNYTIDIGTFARKVREYLELKSQITGKEQYIVFLCDEIGQYIGGDGNLMLNLQSIVEALGTECGGRAWVIATSQQDIDSITKVDRDNFSKIVGRFKTQLSLSSSNVDEVIQKRLLEKKSVAAESLALLYQEKNSTLGNILTFSPDTPEKRVYTTQDEFVAVYPFVPYQSNLLQAVFNGIRTHGAAGKHLSEGERSLLDAFQEAVGQYLDAESGMLVPFHAFYKTVETFLDHNIHKVISDAQSSAEREDGALQPYDVNVLKVLFMIKYVPNILPANLENITTIMLEHIDQDRIETKKIVDASLRRLEQQKLIIKNGSQFIFLTNEEQDINREIREIKIDSSELLDKIGDQVFNVLFGLNKKYRYSDRYDFGCNTIIDERPRGTQRDEIGIRVLTPMYAHGGATDVEVKALSSRERNVFLVLPDEMSFFDEMEQAMQIDTYLRRTAGKSVSDTVEDIKTTKNRESKQRVERCQSLVVEALKRAEFYVNGSRLDIKEKNPQERMNDVLKVLVEGIYTKLSYINSPFYNTESLQTIVRRHLDQTVIMGAETKVENELALSELLERISTSSFKNLALTVRGILDLFGKIPYGWLDMDIAGILLTLFKNQEIRLELAGETIAIDDNNLIAYVTKRDYLDRVTIQARVKIAPHLIANAKTIGKEVFGRSDFPGDEDGLMTRLRELAAGELNRHDPQNPGILQLLDSYKTTRYPGKQVLEDGKTLLSEFAKRKDSKSFFEYIYQEREGLQDYMEDAQDVKKFFQTQQDIFDRALKMLEIYEGNRSYVLDEKTIQIVGELERITKLAAPYSEIHKLPALVQSFTDCFYAIIKAESEPVQEDIKADRQAVREDLAQRSFTAEFKTDVETYYTNLLDRLSHANNIYEVIAMRTESDRKKVGFLQAFDHRVLELARAATAVENQEEAPAVTVRKMKQVSFKKLMAGADQITSKQDIDVLVEQVRTKLEAELAEETTIRII